METIQSKSNLIKVVIQILRWIRTKIMN